MTSKPRSTAATAEGGYYDSSDAPLCLLSSKIWFCLHSSGLLTILKANPAAQQTFHMDVFCNELIFIIQALCKLKALCATDPSLSSSLEQLLFGSDS